MYKNEQTTAFSNYSVIEKVIQDSIYFTFFPSFHKHGPMKEVILPTLEDVQMEAVARYKAQ